MPSIILKKDESIDKHQIDGALFLINRLTGLLQYSTGVGKTITVMLAIFKLLELSLTDKVIIVVPPNAVIAFQDDFNDHSDTSVDLIKDLDSFITFMRSDIKICLVQYNFVDKVTESIPDYIKGIVRYDLVKDFKSILKGMSLTFVFDEFHTLKNPDSKVHKFWYMIRPYMYRVYGMTATSFKTDIMDVYHQIKFLNKKFIGTIGDFKSNYVIESPMYFKGASKHSTLFLGVKNLGDLHNFLKDIMIVYRPVLNEKEIEHLVELSDDSIELYNSASRGFLDSTIEKQHSARLIDLQKVVDNDINKKQKLLSLVNEIAPNNGVLVYCEFQEIADMLIEFLKENTSFRIFSIDGGTSIKKRKLVKDEFHKDPKGSVGVIMPAANTSMNLQATSYLIIYNTPYSPGVYDQLKGRICRMYSKHKTFYLHFIMVNNSIDTYRKERLKLLLEITSQLYDSNSQEVKNPVSFIAFITKRLRQRLLWKTKK